jgi:hypothetical protein
VGSRIGTVSRRTAIATTAAAVALLVNTPTPASEAAHVPAWPAVWPIEIVWQELLTAGELARLERLASVIEDLEVDQVGNLTLTIEHGGLFRPRLVAARLVAELVQAYAFRRDVAYHLSEDPLRDPQVHDYS